MQHVEEKFPEERKWLNTYVRLSDELVLVGSEAALLDLSKAIVDDAEDTEGHELSIFKIADLLAGMKRDGFIIRKAEDGDEMLAKIEV